MVVTVYTVTRPDDEMIYVAVRGDVTSLVWYHRPTILTASAGARRLARIVGLPQ